MKRDDVFALVHRICKYATSYRHDERPGESYEALDGKKKSFRLLIAVAGSFPR